MGDGRSDCMAVDANTDQPWHFCARQDNKLLRSLDMQCDLLKSEYDASEKELRSWMRQSDALQKVTVGGETMNMARYFLQTRTFYRRKGVRRNSDDHDWIKKAFRLEKECERLREAIGYAELHRLDVEHEWVERMRRSTSAGQLQLLPFELLFEVIKQFDDYRFFCCLRAVSKTMRTKFNDVNSHLCLQNLVYRPIWLVPISVQKHVCRMLGLHTQLRVDDRDLLANAFALRKEVVDEMVEMATQLEFLSGALMESYLDYHTKMRVFSTDWEQLTDDFDLLRTLRTDVVGNRIHRNIVWEELKRLISDSGVAFRSVIRSSTKRNNPDQLQQEVDDLVCEVFSHKPHRPPIDALHFVFETLIV